MNMKRNIFGYSILAIYTLLAFSVYSCSDDEDVVEVKGPTINEGKADKILNSAITEWNVSMEEITTRMKNHKLVTSQNEDFLMYSDKEHTSFISYKFFNDSLYSTLVLMPPMSENSDLKNVLKEYSFVGKLEDVDVYLNESENSMVCTSEIVEDSVTYLAVGFTPISPTVLPLFPTTGFVNGHEWVDLGLSVKWATCNVGADSPEDYGDYYAWGETTTKSDYSWETYKWCKGTNKTMTKYCTNSDYGTVDNRTTLTSSDDVATVKWGSKWRMPTWEEMKELDEDCTWTWTTQSGVKGMKVTGPNGNSIFLPAAGYRYGTDLSGRGSYGYYWSATLGEDYSYYAYGLYLLSGNSRWLCNWYRGSGRTVRPVTE